MIKEIQRIRNKYRAIAKHSEYVNINEILCDLYHLEQETRIKRIPKRLR